MMSESKRHWSLEGAARGAWAGLVVALAAALLDAGLAAGRIESLTGAQTAEIFVYATGLLGVLLVPWGVFVGIALAALYDAADHDLRGWLRALSGEPERDLRWSAGLWAGLVGVATLVVMTGAAHGLFLHDLNNKLLASVFAAILAVGSAGVAALSAVIALRAAPLLLRRLPLERLGKPYGLKLIGTLYVLFALGAVIVGVGFLRFYDPNIWSPGYIVQLALVVLGPALAFVLLTRFSARLTGHPAAVIVWLGAVVGLAYLPAVGFTADDPVRIASFEGTELERRALALYDVMGDRDGDGFSGLFGGPDCDDSSTRVNPSAFDEPGNGIDENCIGGDAQVLVREKRSSIPGRLLREVARTLASGGSAGCGATRRGPTRTIVDLKQKNIVFLIVDTMRQDRTGYAGYGREVTPELDKIATRSVVFRHAHSQAPNTPRSMPSIFSGRYPSEVAWKKRFQNFSPVRDDVTTVFEVLAAGGYVNHSVTSHWYFQEVRNLNAGFDNWDNTGWVDIAPSNTDVSSPRIYEKLPGHLDELMASGKPWTMFIHLADPHGRYMKHAGVVPDFGNELVDKYDQDLRFADVYVGKIWELLDSKGLLDTTAVVITSDHGEAFGEHGQHFHGQTIYDEILQVPLVMYLPGVEPIQIDTPVELIDIAPTLLDATGLAIPDSFSGRSLVPAIEEPSSFLPRPTYAEVLACPSWDEEIRALTQGELKLVWRVSKGFYELYNLTNDPTEQKNILRSNSEQAERMKAAMAQFVEQTLRRP
ncbi:MAG: hypothetical protein AUK47_08010 [Deltaproteobacteria bacterium CG2_30_63_29]|nr:MAG: hypothetical protein AUK47_08010 [Deltaproteobacteria bacterium CG2_30_63_29]